MRHLTLHAATWVLSRFVPEGEREALLGDLLEEHALRAEATSSSAALRWYLGQVCASALHLSWARLQRAEWISTVGVALLAFIGMFVVEFIVIEIARLAGTPLGTIVSFAAMVFIAYLAAWFRRRAALVLGAMLLLTVIVQMLSDNVSMPMGYRIAYLVGGPGVAFIGSVLRSATLRKATGRGTLRGRGDANAA